MLHGAPHMSTILIFCGLLTHLVISPANKICFNVLCTTETENKTFYNNVTILIHKISANKKFCKNVQLTFLQVL
jgi:hypothetical protein